MSSLIFDVLWRDHGAQSGMKRLGDTTTVTQQRMTKLKAVAGVTFLALGAAAIKFGKDSVGAYGEAQTSQQQLGFTLAKFPRLADTNRASLQRLNGALQLKTKYDDDAIASGQAVLGSFKMTGRQLEELTPLLLDFASKTGRDLPTAAKTMGQAFIGNTRALKEIGIDYKATGDKGKDFANITRLIRQQVGGLAAEEGKTAAGQLAILENQFGELQEAAGAKLVPALTSLTGWAIKGVQVVGEYGDVLVPAAAGVAGLAAVIWGADKAQKAWAVTTALNSGLAAKSVGGMNALKAAFTGVELTAKASGRAMRIAQLSIPVVGVALFAATTAMTAWASKSDEGTTTTNDFASAMESVDASVTRASAALNENVRTIAVKALQDKGAYGQARRLGISYQDVTDAVLGNQAAIGRVNAALRTALSLNPAAAKANSEQRNTADALAKSLGIVAHESIAATEQERIRRIAMGSSADATRSAKTRSEQLADAQRGLANATKGLNSELQRSIDKMTILRDGSLSVERANLSWLDSLRGLRAASKENGRSLDSQTAKGRANRRAIIGAFEALNEKTTADYRQATASKNASEAVAGANERYRDNRRDLRRAAEAAGYSKTEVDRMIRSYLKTPKKLDTDVHNDAQRAEKKVERYKREIATLKNKHNSVTTSLGFKAGKNFNRVVKGKYVNMGQFGSGGYTGPGDPSEPAGVVHRDEEVIRSQSRRKFEAKFPGLLRHINRHGDLPAGHRDGGTVGSRIDHDFRVSGSASQLLSRVMREAAEYNARIGLREVTERARAAAKRISAESAGGDPGNPGVGSRRHVRWKGGTFTERFRTTLIRAQRLAGRNIPVWQGGFSHRVRASGTSHYGDAIDTAWSPAILRGLRRARVAAWHRTPAQGFIHHIHGVPLHGAGFAGGSGRWQARDYLRGGNGLATGGLVTMPGRYPLAERGPERVLSARQTVSFERLTAAIARSGGAPGQQTIRIEVNAPHYVGSQADLVRALTRAESLGQLDALKRRLLR